MTPGPMPSPSGTKVEVSPNASLRAKPNASVSIPLIANTFYNQNIQRVTSLIITVGILIAFGKLANNLWYTASKGCNLIS